METEPMTVVKNVVQDYRYVRVAVIDEAVALELLKLAYESECPGLHATRDAAPPCPEEEEKTPEARIPFPPAYLGRHAE